MREKEREACKVRKKKREDPTVYRCMHSHRNQVPRSVLHRAHRGRGGGDVGGSGRIDRVWAATNPRFSSLSLSSIRSSSLHLSSTCPAHSSLLLHSSLFFSHRVLCISSAFSLFNLDSPFVLPSCTSFSSFRSHALSPPSFLFPSFSLQSLYSLPRFPPFHDIRLNPYRVRLVALSASNNNCPIELLSRYQALEFLGQGAIRMRIYSLTNRRMESQR